MGTFLDILWFLLKAAFIMTLFVGVYVGWHIGLDSLKTWRYRRASRGRDIVGM